MVWALYQFDRELKLLVNDAIEKIEVAFRAAIFNYAPTMMDSWLETLVYTRNLCAHHSRLWNRWFVAAPVIPKGEACYKKLSQTNRKFIAIAYVITKLLKEIAPKSHWQKNLFNLFNKYEEYPGIEMGSESDWRKDLFWEMF